MDRQQNVNSRFQYKYNGIYKKNHLKTFWEAYSDQIGKHGYLV